MRLHERRDQRVVVDAVARDDGVDACRLREARPDASAHDGNGDREGDGARGEAAGKTVCIIAQQLRSDQVFEAWLAAFAEAFRVWRVPDELAGEGLRGGEGFVVHVGVLR